MAEKSHLFQGHGQAGLYNVARKYFSQNQLFSGLNVNQGICGKGNCVIDLNANQCQSILLNIPQLSAMIDIDRYF